MADARLDGCRCGRPGRGEPGPRGGWLRGRESGHVMGAMDVPLANDWCQQLRNAVDS